ncbi:exodeoxyribonuclease V subunit alpha [Gordonia sp. VNQ95]|uniref:exodeoxyribonuclease V subunit alpha n=1 Tax=Gordonia sp. VNQ95 TaxID=3156619 RepID=UPI0032B4748F
MTTSLGPQRVLAAEGILGRANVAGFLDAADVHVVSRLVDLCGESVSEVAQLAAAFAVRAVRQGSTCLALADLDPVGSNPADIDDEDASADPMTLPTVDEMVDALRTCPLIVGSESGPLRPLVLVDSDDGPLLYLSRYFEQEEIIRTALAERADDGPAVAIADIVAAVDDAFATSPTASPRQRLAAAIAASRWTSVLTGGPGTGKTYTVARILAVLDRLGGSRLQIAVCAPTGRAVAQLQASLDGMRGDDTTADPAVHAVTVHGLLGWRPGSVPRYGRTNRLPHDVVVVDETSMLSVTAMSHLLEAVRPTARLILVGDPHQLASVEAGAVLADLVEREPSGVPIDAALADLVATAGLADAELPRLADGIVALTDNFRNRGGIAAVAAAVNVGDADHVLELVADDAIDDVVLVEPEDPGIRAAVVAWGRALRSAATSGDASAALDALDTHRVLCAHREGQWGVEGWTRRIVEWLAEAAGHGHLMADRTRPIPGVPILVTANDRQNKVFNGDCGVMIHRAEGDAVAFRRSEFSEPVTVAPHRLAETMWAYAMTIHRSQGSQFGAVTVVLPPADSPLLTRELLYTAITRAQSTVRIVGTPEMLRAAVDRRVHRASGLRSAIRPMIDPEP